MVWPYVYGCNMHRGAQGDNCMEQFGKLRKNKSARMIGLKDSEGIELNYLAWPELGAMKDLRKGRFPSKRLKFNFPDLFRDESSSSSSSGIKGEKGSYKEPTRLVDARSLVKYIRPSMSWRHKREKEEGDRGGRCCRCVDEAREISPRQRTPVPAAVYLDKGCQTWREIGTQTYIEGDLGGKEVVVVERRDRVLEARIEGKDRFTQTEPLSHCKRRKSRRIRRSNVLLALEYPGSVAEKEDQRKPETRAVEESISREGDTYPGCSERPPTVSPPECARGRHSSRRRNRSAKGPPSEIKAVSVEGKSKISGLYQSKEDIGLADGGEGSFSRSVGSSIESLEELERLIESQHLELVARGVLPGRSENGGPLNSADGSSVDGISRSLEELVEESLSRGPGDGNRGIQESDESSTVSFEPSLSRLMASLGIRSGSESTSRTDLTEALVALSEYQSQLDHEDALYSVSGKPTIL